MIFNIIFFKNLNAELKNKRSGLSDACQRLERELEKIHIPQVKIIINIHVNVYE